MKKHKSKAVFKQYNPNQMLLLPPELGSLIGEHHPVRIVSRVIDQLDLSPLLAKYKGGGSSAYHPKMLLKVLIYGYLKNIYSSRKLEEALRENIHFMWLSGMARPDHSTISDFRSNRLKDLIKDIFTQVVLLLVEEGLVDIKTIYTDGTKIEANANRYTFVWAKAIATNKEKIKERLAGLWAYVEEQYKQEQKELASLDFTEISAEKVKETIDKINEALAGRDLPSEIKKKIKYAEKNYIERLEKYEKQEAILAGRNSYSKTDEDATFMRTKDDHMKNGQLKPCYNVQFSTSNQVVVHYSLGQTSTDTSLYIDHLKSYEASYGCYPQTVVADAGYGSEENYNFLAEQELVGEEGEQKQIEAYVKYSYFHKEQKRKHRLDPSQKSNLHYNEAADCYYCPMGQKMEKVYQRTQQTKTGYLQYIDVYQAKNCQGCPMRGVCHRSKANRKVYRNAKLEDFKQQAREKLNSEEGKVHRGQRCADVEASFGQLKANKGFRRFLTRGLAKVNIELGLVAISMNLAKLAKFKAGVCPYPSKSVQIEANKEQKVKLSA
jgi:transposase